MGNKAMDRKRKARAKKVAAVDKAVKTKGASIALGIAKKAAKPARKAIGKTDRAATKAVRRMIGF